MTRAASFTEAEMARAARVANAERAVVRLERGGMVVEVKPVDLDADQGAGKAQVGACNA